MKDQISLAWIIIFIIFMAGSGFFAALRAAESTEELKKKELPSGAWISFIVIPAASALIFKSWASLIVYTVILLLLAGMQLLNREGKMRRQSWNILAVAYSIMLILSAVYHRGTSFAFLFWFLPILCPFIASIFNAVRLNGKAEKSKDSSQLRGRIVSIGFIVLLTILLVALLIAIFTRR